MKFNIGFNMEFDMSEQEIRDMIKYDLTQQMIKSQEQSNRKNEYQYRENVNKRPYRQSQDINIQFDNLKRSMEKFENALKNIRL